MRPSRALAGLLALWIGLQPAALLAGEAARLERAIRGYARGEASFGELQEARVRHATWRAARTRARALPGPPRAPDASPGDTGEGVAPDEGHPLTRVADWIRDLPGRLVRRLVPDRKGLTSIREIEELVDSSPVEPFSGNATQREAESDATRPLRVTAQLEAYKVQGVIERLVAFGGLQALHRALSGEGTGTRVLERAGRVVSRLTAGERSRVVRGLSGSSLGKHIGRLLGGKPGSRLGRLIKDRFGNNILLAVAASGLVGLFLDDALDLETLKDHLVALNTVHSVRSRREQMLMRPLEAVAYYHMDRGVSGLFQRLWSRLTTGSGGLAGALRGAERAVSGVGGRLVRPVPAHLAQKAAEAGRQASSLGLPGVNGATSLTLKGMAGAAFKAGTLGLVGMPALATAWKLVAGLEDGTTLSGNRGKVFARYDLATTYYQRTGDPVGDALRERKVAVANLWEGYGKFPFTNALDWVLRFAGGYVGAIAASALFPPLGIAGLLGTLVVSAVFSEGGVALGRWLGAKLDTSAWFYGHLRDRNMRAHFEAVRSMRLGTPKERRAREALAAVDRARARLGIRTREDLARLREQGAPELAELDRLAARYLEAREEALVEVAAVAFARARDFEQLMRVSQVNGRIRLVESFDDVKLVTRDGVEHLVAGDWSAEASPRYDLVTVDGRRGVWDPKRNRVLDVGRIREQNGKRIAFLDDDGVRVIDGVLHPPASEEIEARAGNAYFTSNGIVFEKSASGEWLVRGYGGEYDVVLRDSRRRFAWDGERFVEVVPERRGPASDESREAAGRLARRLVEGALPLGEHPTRQALADLGRLHRGRRPSPQGELRP